MIQTILLNILLGLVAIWLLLLIRYTYYYIHFSRRWDTNKLKREQGEQAAIAGDKPEKHRLVTKSRGLEPQPIEPSEAIATEDTGAVQTSEPSEAMPENDDEADITDEENEMEVAYTMDEGDEEEILREELLFTGDEAVGISPSAILARELLSLGRWSTQDDALDEAAQEELQTTLRKVQGTELIERYAEHLQAEKSKYMRFMSAIRQAPEAVVTEEGSELFHEPSSSQRDLDYYL